MPPRERRLIRIASDARTGARINRFHEQVDAVAVEATSNATARSSRLLSLLRDTSRRLLASLACIYGIVDTFIGKVATARIVSGKKPITVIRRKNASAAKLRAIQLKSDG